MKLRLFAALALPAAMLAACSNDPEPVPVDNVAEFDVPEPILNRPDPVEPPPPANVATAEPVDLPDEEQIQFDAEAAGMTARIDRSQDELDAAPVEPVRE